LVVEEGGFLYDSDAYNDDVPYYKNVLGKKHLIIPYTADVNDFSFWENSGFVTADEFGTYLKDTFNVLYEESATYPKMMSIGLHPRIIGRPGRALALQQFLEYATQFQDVWFATREEIARWWIANT
jgi:peptidoglycan/xylan/chitin deacetylase (PgdA/CDA1 family)